MRETIFKYLSCSKLISLCVTCPSYEPFATFHDSSTSVHRKQTYGLLWWRKTACQLRRTQKLTETTWGKIVAGLSERLSVLQWITRLWLNELCLRVMGHMHTHTEQIWKSIPWLNSQTIGPLLFIHQLNCPH